MARRIVKAAAVPLKRPANVSAIDPAELVAELRGTWAEVCPRADLAPFVARFENLPAPVQLRLADLVATMIATDSVAAKSELSELPEAVDLAVLLLVRRDPYVLFEGAAATLVTAKYAAARPIVFELLCCDHFGSAYDLVDLLATLGPIDDAMIDRAIGEIDRAPLGSAYMLAYLLNLRSDVERAFAALLARFDRQACAHQAAYAIQRLGLRVPAEIPRLERLLRTGDDGVRQAAAIALAAMGEESGRRWLERESRALERM